MRTDKDLKIKQSEFKTIVLNSKKNLESLLCVSKKKFFNKKFDFVCSIGEDCACTSYLRKFNLQEASYPFDWLTKPGLKTRIDCIVNNFNDFLEEKYFRFLPKTQKLLDNKNDYYENTALDFYFYHDFPIGIPFEEAFKAFKEKYKRRIERFYKKIKSNKHILFVWHSKDKILDNNLIIESHARLVEKFKRQNIYLLIFENDFDSTDISYINLHKNILKVISNFATYDKSDPMNEVMGNLQRNEEVFLQIKFKRSYFKYFLNKIIKKTIKYFSFFIFPSKIRKTIRKKLTTKLIMK